MIGSVSVDILSEERSLPTLCITVKTVYECIREYYVTRTEEKNIYFSILTVHGKYEKEREAR